jgi:hypothetical protein
MGGADADVQEPERCVASHECPPDLVCDDAMGRCVQCVLDSHCKNEELCLGGLCRATCDSDDDCAHLQLLCDLAKGRCVECVQPDDCDTPSTCTPDGVCEALGTGGSGGSGGSGGTGGSGGAGGTPGEAPVVILLVDQSSSMADAFLSPSVTRWDALREAILSEQGAVRLNESRAAFGLYTYTTLEPNFDPTCPLVRGVAPQVNNFAAIQSYYLNESLPIKSETPTGAAVMQVTDMLANVPNAKHVILITDGEPDTCDVRDPQCGHDPALFALQRAFDAAIAVHVFGIGDGDQSPGWFKFLQDAANAGAGQPIEQPTLAHRQTCEPLIGTFGTGYSPVGGIARYYLSPQQGITQVLDTIIGSIVN